MSNIEVQYLELLSKVFNHGHKTTDRTGTGTLSVFGHQIRHDMSLGFPLLTTKKVFWRGVVEELLWMLRGETNIQSLKDKNVNIWNEWADESGELGPVYGKQWRGWTGVVFNKIKTFDKGNQESLGPIIGMGKVLEPFKHTKNPLRKHLYQTWYAMLKRCYDPKHPAFQSYGGSGVFVDNRWLIFENFLEDVKKLDNWILKKHYTNEYSLDKDFYGSNKYGPDTCRWSSKLEQSTNIKNNSNLFIATDPNGYSTVEYGLRPFCDKYALCKPSVSQVLKGVYKRNDGWSFQKIKQTDGQIARIVHVDQIKKIISEIKENSNSRRLIVSAWNAVDLPRMKLEPCHCFFQFKVYGNKLNLQLYQRSADLFLGVPFNIASYALLLQIVAKATGLEPGEFIHTFGDAHIYLNHTDQVMEQMSRQAWTLPTVEITKEFTDPAELRFEDFLLKDYLSHPPIKGAVSV